MNHPLGSDKQQLIFSALVFAPVLVLALLVFFPFLNVLALSAVLAVLLSPLHRAIAKKVKIRSISAGLTILILIAVIVMPLILIVNNIVTEAQALYANASANPTLSSDQITNWIEGKVQVYVPNFTVDARGYLSAFSAWVVSKLGGIFSGTIDFVFKFALSFVALFYFLRDGDKLKKHVIALTPWSKEKDELVIHSLRSSIRSVVIGSLAVALIQGLLTGLSFAITGVPNPTLWGTLAAVCALIPGVGTAIVWIPAVIFLFVTDPSGWPWIAQLLTSVFLVGLIDNFLAPIIMEKGINIHPLLILFSVLGGIQFFGPEGFLLGPLVLSLLFVLVRTFKNDSSLEKDSLVKDAKEDPINNVA